MIRPIGIMPKYTIKCGDYELIYEAPNVKELADLYNILNPNEQKYASGGVIPVKTARGIISNTITQKLPMVPLSPDEYQVIFGKLGRDMPPYKDFVKFLEDYSQSKMGCVK